MAVSVVHSWNFPMAYLTFILLFSFILTNEALPFKLPSPLPTWPQGGDFGKGVIDLGGLKLQQITSFKPIWTSNENGPDNLGATFYEPSSIPDGYSMLGGYAQPNNQPLFGWILVGKSDSSDELGQILKQPTDYTLIWPQNNISTNPAYFWLPTPPDGYKAIGLIITTSVNKPSLDKIRCVRYDYIDEAETDTWIWSQAQAGFNVYGLRPRNRGTKAQGLSAGTFMIQTKVNDTLSCLKNKKSTLSTMPNLSQIEALFQTYSPYIYFYSKENYLPSSVNWYFTNGAVLYKAGEESNPITIELNGSNLPQGGSGTYWMDANDKEEKGDLQTAEVYLHVKPILGATFTDIQVWIFYPFNGPAAAKLGIFKRIPLGKIGEHVGDWEHVTLRISNLDGVLYKVYFAEHGGGKWVDSSSLEFQNGNKFVGYSSRNGHASYNKAGVVLQGGDGDDIGIINETDKSDIVMDSGERFVIVAADGLKATEVVAEPPWLNYCGGWGPKKIYKLEKELEKIERFLPKKLKSRLENVVHSLPPEVLGEEGPIGPKMKMNWNGDED